LLKYIIAIANALLVIATLALFGSSILGYASRLDYTLDNLSQLRLAYLYAQLVLIGISLLFRFKAPVIIGLAALIVDLFDMKSMLLPGRSAIKGHAQISLVTLNLWGDRNTHYEDVLSYVHKTHPDVLCVNEISSEWMLKLIEGLPDYPNHFEQGTEVVPDLRAKFLVF